jgi:predicted nucleotidyltransferase
MRRNSTLAALFPTIRGRLLAALIPNPQRWWYLSELASHLGTSPSSLQRELSSLVKANILEQRVDGRRTYYRAVIASPIYQELRGIFEKTVGVVPSLRKMFSAFIPRIEAAFIYGSIARSEEHAESDIDLFIVGEIGLAELAPSLKKAERELGREINPVVYTASEFRKAAKTQDHFVISVLKAPKQFVKGSERELGILAGQSSNTDT